MTGAPDLTRARELLAARLADQRGIPTFYDNYVGAAIKALENGDSGRESGVDAAADSAASAAERTLRSFFELAGGDRFQDPEARLRRSTKEVLRRMAVPWVAYTASQGALRHLTWNGHALFKTVYDLAAYPMLVHELKPATIIELGSGTGASASWLADMCAPLPTRPRILSVDREEPEVSDSRVEFHRLDINRIGRFLTAEFAAGLAHPWLVIEDAHVNVAEVLSTVHALLEPGDYFVVEDSIAKRGELLDLVTTHPGGYALDTHYCDLFGENSTCAMDSFLVRRAD